MKSYLMKSDVKTYGPFTGSALRHLDITPKNSFQVTVPAALYEYVKLRADQNVRCMSKCEYFTIEDLFNADDWAGLDDKEKSNAAMCLGYLYLSGGLPLFGTDFNLVPPEGYYIEDEKLAGNY